MYYGQNKNILMNNWTDGEKTDVTCRSCHRIETSTQIQKGIIRFGWERLLPYLGDEEEIFLTSN